MKIRLGREAESEAMLTVLLLCHVAEVRIKFYTVPSDMLEELFDEGEDIDLDEVVSGFDRDEEDLDEDGEGEGELDAFGKPKVSDAKAPQQQLSRDYPAGSSTRTSSGNKRGGGSVGSGKFGQKGKKGDSEVKVFTINLGDIINFDDDKDDESSEDSPKRMFSTFFDQIMVGVHVFQSWWYHLAYFCFVLFRIP